MQEYINLKYKPKDNEIIAKFHIEPEKGKTIPEVANHVAGESSIDTWSEIRTLSPEIAKKLKPSVFYINKNVIKIAYSPELFEKGSIAQLLSAVAGNILSMKNVKNLKLYDITFPKTYIDAFKGPEFGIPGIRQLFKVKNRPFLGTIVKPKVGLNSKQHAHIAYQSWLGGLDLVKDDENLTDQAFNRFEDRLKETLKLRKKAEEETKQKKMYMINITAPDTEEMLARAKLVKKYGGEYAMIDIIPTGWTALQTLRKENSKLKLVLHAHRCGHSGITRNFRHGISMLVIAKLCRLLGFDQLHTGTVIGKMDGSKYEVFGIDTEMEEQEISAIAHTLRMPKHAEEYDLLPQNWYNIKPLFPVASGGLHPLMIPSLYKMFGKDIILQFGGGIHAHPKGTYYGAKAASQALDAAMKKIPLKEYAKNHPELKDAIKKWGKE